MYIDINQGNIIDIINEDYNDEINSPQVKPFKFLDIKGECDWFTKMWIAHTLCCKHSEFKIFLASVANKNSSDIKKLRSLYKNTYAKSVPEIVQIITNNANNANGIIVTKLVSFYTILTENEVVNLLRLMPMKCAVFIGSHNNFHALSVYKIVNSAYIFYNSNEKSSFKVQIQTKLPLELKREIGFNSKQHISLYLSFFTNNLFVYSTKNSKEEMRSYMKKIPINRRTCGLWNQIRFSDAHGLVSLIRNKNMTNEILNEILREKIKSKFDFLIYHNIKKDKIILTFFIYAMLKLSEGRRVELLQSTFDSPKNYLKFNANALAIVNPGLIKTMDKCCTSVGLKKISNHAKEILNKKLETLKILVSLLKAVSENAKIGSSDLTRERKELMGMLKGFEFDKHFGAGNLYASKVQKKIIQFENVFLNITKNTDTLGVFCLPMLIEQIKWHIFWLTSGTIPAVNKPKKSMLIYQLKIFAIIEEGILKLKKTSLDNECLCQQLKILHTRLVYIKHHFEHVNGKSVQNFKKKFEKFRKACAKKATTYVMNSFITQIEYSLSILGFCKIKV